MAFPMPLLKSGGCKIRLASFGNNNKVMVLFCLENKISFQDPTN